MKLFFILDRIMFLYLGNMYVLVISLLNKINQVRERKIGSLWIAFLVGSILAVVVVILISFGRIIHFLSHIPSLCSPRVLLAKSLLSLIPRTQLSFLLLWLRQISQLVRYSRYM